MATATVTLTVPPSGDGPFSDISSLVGQKTVKLSGSFTGSYTLLVSDDDTTFVPAAFFDAGGVEGFEQTISGAFKSARVRSNAFPQGAVSMSVTGVVSPGDNKFTVLASIPVGSGGIQPPVDLATLFPPSGLEDEIAILCRGNFAGDLVVEGSNDGIEWNPVGEFQAGPSQPSLLGNLQVLEFSPRSTRDLIRFLRVNANAQILGATTVTVGGRIPSASATGADTVDVIHEDAGKSTTIGAAGPEILYEETADLTGVPVGTPISVHFSGIILTSANSGPLSAGTYEIWVGATNPGDTTGATMRATATSSAAVETVISALGAPFLNPGGDKVLVQLVASDDIPVTEHADIRGLAIKIFA